MDTMSWRIGLCISLLHLFIIGVTHGSSEYLIGLGTFGQRFDSVPPSSSVTRPLSLDAGKADITGPVADINLMVSAEVLIRNRNSTNIKNNVLEPGIEISGDCRVMPTQCKLPPAFTLAYSPGPSLLLKLLLQSFALSSLISMPVWRPRRSPLPSSVI